GSLQKPFFFHRLKFTSNSSSTSRPCNENSGMTATMQPKLSFWVSVDSLPSFSVLYACFRKLTLSPCVQRPPECVQKGCWCQGGHPVLGGRLPLSIPPQAMDQGLYGELSIQPVTLLSPCVLQFPNLATQLTHIQISFADFIIFLAVIVWNRICS
uniref:Uncharacterized protein n=1 Tax=Lates calcarifer TaxID=8187 RepID=A0A4W6C2M8_LATCA